MLFGQSVFQSVVERLKREAEENQEEDQPEPAYKVRGFSSGFVLESAIQETGAANIRADAYLDFLPDPPPPPVEPEPEPMPDYLARTSLEDVSAELAISGQDTAVALSEKRRSFARLNHPDRVHPDFRDNANLRMTAANLLIDQAISFITR